MGTRAIARGTREGPFAYVIPPTSTTPRRRPGWSTCSPKAASRSQQASEPSRLGDTVYPAGTAFVLMAQPFRAYAKSLLEAAALPVSGSWRAPRHPSVPTTSRGGRCRSRWACGSTRSTRRSRRRSSRRSTGCAFRPRFRSGYPKPDYYLVDARGNAGALAANRLLAAGLQVEWTSGVVTQDGFTYAPGTLVVRPVKEARPTVERLARDLGVRVFGARGKPPASAPIARAARRALPSVDRSDRRGLDALAARAVRVPVQDAAGCRGAGGRPQGRVRRDHPAVDRGAAAGRGQPHRAACRTSTSGGLGRAGVAALKAFVEAGGTLVCLDASAQLAIDALDTAGEERRAGPACRAVLLPGLARPARPRPDAAARVRHARAQTRRSSRSVRRGTSARRPGRG